MKIKKHFPLHLLLAFLFFAGFSACNNHNTEDESNKVRVLSSFSILSEMVEAIGGEHVQTHNLVPVGTDPHEYEPKPGDIKFASKADLFVYNGLNLEGGDQGWYMKLLRSVKADPDRIFKVTDQIKPMYLSEKDGSKEVNPHAFISPAVGIVMSRAIRDALITVDEDHKEFYEKNAAEYIDKLQKIDQKYRETINQIPENQRILITSEQAFQYMNHEYGLKEGFIWAIDTDENGSPEQIKATIDFVRKNHPPVLFVESNVDRRPMETVSRETGVPIYSPAIFSDELGKPGREGDTYLKYLEYNLKHIYRGLTGHDKWED